MRYPENLHFIFPWEKCEDMTKRVIDYLGDRDRIIDVGYEDGYLLKKIRETYPQKELVGVDILKEKEFTKESNIHSLVGNIENLPLSTDSFDGLICTFVLDYVDKQKAIDEIQRILKFNGKAVVYLHHPNSGLIGKFKEGLSQQPKNGELKYYIDTLESNVFKNDKECENYFRKRMLIERLGLWSGVDSKDDTRKEYCFELFLRNKTLFLSCER